MDNMFTAIAILALLGLYWELHVRLVRLEGVQGPERRLVGPAAQRPQPDDAEALREGSGVEPVAEQSKCPACDGEGWKYYQTSSGYEPWCCQECKGTGERSGRLNDSAVAAAPSDSD